MNEKQKPQIHVSHMTRMMMCGEQYRRIYVLGQRKPPGIAAHIGSANHRAHDTDIIAKLEKKPIPDLDVTNDMVRDTINHLAKEEGFMPSGQGSEKQELGAAIDRGVRMNGVRHRELVPTIRPTRVKHKWIAELDGCSYDLAGETDVEDEVFPVRDLKTSGGYPAKDMAHASLQLSMYSMFRHLCEDIPMPMPVALDVLTDKQNKKSITTKLTHLPSVREQSDIDMLLARVHNFIECLEKGVFIPADPSSWICNPKWCGWFDECPYARRRVTVQV